MIYVIVYDRELSKSRSIQAFDDNDQASARRYRAQLELRPENRRGNVEIVSLQASSIEELQRTHGRYFLSAREMNDQLIEELRRTLP